MELERVFEFILLIWRNKMLLKIMGLGLRSDYSEIGVEYDQWLGLDETAGIELLKKLQIIGVIQWSVTSKPIGRLDLIIKNPDISHSIRLVKHVLFQHFPDATIQAIYPR